MTTLTPAQTRRARDIADKIEAMEQARNDAQDAEVVLELGAPTVTNPMGADYRVKVAVLVSANDIRMALVAQLTPLYSELRAMNIDLQLP